MKLKVLEIDFHWTEEISVDELSPLIIARLSKHGDPLRWAITAIQPYEAKNLFRQLKVEAVVIIA